MSSTSRPALSVITPSFNHGRFLVDTIESIRKQTFTDYEYVVVDGGSSDNTVDILREYPWINWRSEPDDGVLDAYRKAFQLTRGEYVIQCCVSDGFIDDRWFARCVEVLEADPEVSLVWGLPQHMAEDGSMGPISYAEYLVNAPPQKQAFFPYWLVSGFFVPEGNYCVRRDVLMRCFPFDDQQTWRGQASPHLQFVFNFHRRGYLSWFLPTVANYGRTHADQRTNKYEDTIARDVCYYRARITALRRALALGREFVTFRDGQNQPLNRFGRSQLLACPLWSTSRLLSRASSRLFRAMSGQNAKALSLFRA